MLPAKTTEVAQHLGLVNSLSELEYRQLHQSPQSLYKSKQLLVKEGVKGGHDGPAQQMP